jgi:nicotinamidase-related amidase
MSASETAADLAIRPERAALLIIDIQDRLATAMPEEILLGVERNVAILCEMARRMAIPIVLSEQYPKGLGATRKSVADAVGSGDRVHRFEKTVFGVGEAPEFAPIWDQLGRDQWLVTGMECHVCVYQSVRQLRARGAAVHVVRDAVLSRTKGNWKIGAKLCARAGAVLTSTEVVLFDVLGHSGHPEFKALSKLIR